jgi:hypothetical protein
MRCAMILLMTRYNAQAKKWKKIRLRTIYKDDKDKGQRQKDQDKKDKDKKDGDKDKDKKGRRWQG